MRTQQLIYKADEKRILWLDVMRIVAISGVVTIHSFVLPPISSGNLNGNTFFIWFIFTLAKTSIPLFLMLSGALLIGKEETWQIFWHKRLRRLVLPWLFWTLVFLVVKYADRLNGITGTANTFRSIMSAEFSFIPALLCLYLLVPYWHILVKHATHLQRWQLISLWAFGISILPYWRNTLAFPAIVDNGLVRQTINYSGYFLLGFELKNFFTQQKYSSKMIFYLLTLLLGSSLATLSWQISHPSNPPLFLSYVAPGIVLSSIAVFSLLQMQISTYEKKWSDTSVVRRFATELSLASFGVFFAHPLVVPFIHTITGLPGNEHNLGLQLLNATLTIFIVFFSILTLKQVPGLKKVVS